MGRGVSFRLIEAAETRHDFGFDQRSFTPDGKRLLLTVASGSNAALDMFPWLLSLAGLTGGIRLIRSVLPGTAKKAALIFCPLIPTVRTRKSMPREFEIPQVLPYSLRQANYGRFVNERDGLGDQCRELRSPW